MRWINVADYDELSEQAAQLVVSQLCMKPDSVLGVATGGTPIGMYTRLVKRYRSGNLSFKSAITFNLDEYVGVRQEEPESYHFYMTQHFYQYINLPESNRNIPNGMAADLTVECERYESAIATSGGIDLQVIGIGQNGHIGFNEPGTSYHSKTHVIELADSTRKVNAKYFPAGKEVPERAITMGIQTIMKARHIILLAYGEEKREALNQLKNGSRTEAFPASCLHAHPNVTVLYSE